MGYEVGVGTGVLTALLLRRGVRRVVATDVNPRALACARDNLTRLQLMDRVTLVEGDWLAAVSERGEGTMEHLCQQQQQQGRADLIVCNPPWLPLAPHSLLDRGVYDLHSDMLQAFLRYSADPLFNMPDFLTF